MTGADLQVTGGQETRQKLSFLLLYTLAAAGGSIAYVPFLTILLPIQVTGIAGRGDVSLLAYLAFAGAVAASLANIGFGWASDLTRSRRPWIVGGLVLSSIIMIVMRDAATPFALVLTLIAWQLGLNMMLAPLAAWAGDCVPDDQKGLLGGLLSFCPALGALSGALITLPGLADASARPLLVVGLVTALVLPALLFAHPRPMPELVTPDLAAEQASRPSGRAIALMWIARLLVQIAEAALFAYILFWFRSIDPAFGDNRVATLFGVVLATSVPLALLAGIWSDRKRRPILPLALAAGVAAVGLCAMSLGKDIEEAVMAYVVFGLATGVFLSLHTAQTLRVLPRADKRGRDLGFFNLTNTVPSLVMPWLALGMMPLFGFAGLFLLLAALALAAALLLVALDRL